uniref:NADH dehydrogenase subunit 6 n=1 Tax=Nycteribia formosana TaxID=3016857 RepID=UPI002551E7F4|nr:NADH dehydrogenase subunit 6 [Nycteribia formosana]WGL38774.1 NADH dehydrogenase subunit 6 [Nycteribia formosana]
MIQWYLLFFLFSFNYIFFITKHPLTMSLILMIQTLIISILSSMMNKNSWFSFILFLIFIGALLILFIYITSLTSNKLFNFSYKMIIMPLMFFFIFYLINKNLYMWNFMNSDMLNMNNYNKISNLYELIMLFNYPSNMLIFMIMMYLLFTLISIIKITKFNKGPFRMMN